eukprot:6507945-Pyramimonas_sp.AAC.3
MLLSIRAGLFTEAHARKDGEINEWSSRGVTDFYQTGGGPGGRACRAPPPPPRRGRSPALRGLRARAGAQRARLAQRWRCV